MTDAPAFDAFYYAHSCGRPYARDDEWLRFFGGIADRITADMTSASARASADRPASAEAPLRVLDAGCAMGLLVEALVARGVDAYGIDISDYAISQAAPEVRGRCRVASLTAPLEGRYDLIVCIEVLEHMPADEADRAIANFAAHTDDVLFSSTPFDYREPTHINVRMPEDWAEAFARHGFYRDVDFDASFITKWAVRFTRRSVAAPRLVRDYERRFWQARAAEHDARAYSLELQQRLDAVERERDRLAPFEPEVHELRILRGDLEETANTLRQELTGARNTIAAMERSLFWRARLLMVRLRQMFRS
jgi:SAM-dependent methyltransferase